MSDLAEFRDNLIVGVSSHAVLASVCEPTTNPLGGGAATGVLIDVGGPQQRRRLGTR